MNYPVPRLWPLALCAALSFLPAVARAETAPVIVAGPPKLTGTFLSATLESFAAARGLGLNREFQGNGELHLVLSLPDQPAGGITLILKPGNSARAREAVADGAAQIALVRAPITETAGRILAEDATVAVVARDNPVHSITPGQLSAVLRGEISNWSDLGGPDLPITVYLIEPRTDGAALADYYFLHGAPPASETRAMVSEQALTDAVALDPAGIGLSSHSELGNTRPLALSGACEIAVVPNRLAIRNEDYPLSFAISLVAGQGDLPPLLADYLGFLGSPAAQAAIRQTGLVDLDPETQPLAAQGRRLVSAIKLSGTEVPAADLQRLARTLDGQGRLSATFRFEPGSSTLDPGSVQRVARMAAELASGRYDGRSLTFVGFSDGVGAPEQNLKIGLSRAQAVEAAVRAAAGDLKGHSVTLGSDSFGETLPIACDDSEWGRLVNRRVEVWIR